MVTSAAPPDCCGQQRCFPPPAGLYMCVPAAGSTVWLGTEDAVLLPVCGADSDTQYRYNTTGEGGGGDLGGLWGWGSGG